MSLRPMRCNIIGMARTLGVLHLHAQSEIEWTTRGRNFIMSYRKESGKQVTEEFMGMTPVKINNRG